MNEIAKTNENDKGTILEINKNNQKHAFKSIFQSEKLIFAKYFKFWYSPKIFEKLPSNLENVFYKKQKIRKKWISRYYFVTDKYLGYKRVMPFENVFVDFFITEDSFEFGIKFIKNNEFFSIFTKEKSIWDDWSNYLDSVCLKTSFHYDFHVEKMIGKGNFARVYLSKKIKNEEKFAIKCFTKNKIMLHEKGRDSLFNEIQILRQMNHENIIKLYDVYETENSIYLVMDLLSGGELLKSISEKKIFSENNIKTLMNQLLNALAYMHEKGIMHRDIKPENILFENENSFKIKIADFGLASFIKAKKMLFIRCGTPGYVAPEVLNYKEPMPMYGEACDIYSAGIIFYIL